ncbi:hypothetical protein Bbelb_042480 [Branchiostoma belcheri]|nr:hypothetical protein Bbelb_042480 [Branchiostoma belcheri]
MTASKSLVFTLVVVTVLMVAMEAQGISLDQIRDRLRERQEATEAETEDQELEEIMDRLRRVESSVNRQSRIVGQMGRKLKELENLDMPDTEELREMRQSLANMSSEVQVLRREQHRQDSQSREEHQQNSQSREEHRQDSQRGALHNWVSPKGYEMEMGTTLHTLGGWKTRSPRRGGGEVWRPLGKPLGQVNRLTTATNNLALTCMRPDDNMTLE